MKVVQEAEAPRRTGTTEALCLEPLDIVSSRTEGQQPGMDIITVRMGVDDMYLVLLLMAPPLKVRIERRKGKKDGGGEGRGEDGGQTADGASGNSGERQGQRNNGQANRGKRQPPQSNDEGRETPPPLQLPTAPVTANPELPASPGADNALDPIAKKARNLNKKLKAIEELKDKAKRGERLEVTQLRKMEGEVEIRKELAALGL